MTRRRKYKKEYGKELLLVAKGDLESARVLHKAGAGRPENAVFHAEQAIEKTLKAVLCWKGIAVPLTHVLPVIIDSFPESIEVPEAESMTDLDQFATIRRYLEGPEELTAEEVAAVIQLAERTLLWAGGQIA